MDTYPLIVLMKLDFPAPESPVIAMSTSTSCHPSILLLKYFTMEPGLRRPFFSTSFWKSCTHFDSQFIAKGRLETERYRNESGPQQRQGFIMLRPVHVTRIFDPSACAWVYYSHTQRGAGEWWSPKSRPFGWGKNKLHGFDPIFLLVDSSRIHLFYDKFPTVTIHNLPTPWLEIDSAGLKLYSICKSCLPGLNFKSVRLRKERTWTGRWNRKLIYFELSL